MTFHLTGEAAQGYTFSSQTGGYHTYGAKVKITSPRELKTVIWDSDGDAFFSVLNADGEGCVIASSTDHDSNSIVNVYHANNTICYLEQSDLLTKIYVDTLEGVECQWLGVSCEGNMPRYSAHISLYKAPEQTSFVALPQQLCCTADECVTFHYGQDPSTCAGEVVQTASQDCTLNILKDGQDAQIAFTKSSGSCVMAVSTNNGDSYTVMRVADKEDTARVSILYKKGHDTKVVRTSKFHYILHLL